MRRVLQHDVEMVLSCMVNLSEESMVNISLGVWHWVLVWCTGWWTQGLFTLVRGQTSEDQLTLVTLQPQVDVVLPFVTGTHALSKVEPCSGCVSGEGEEQLDVNGIGDEDELLCTCEAGEGGHGDIEVHHAER